MIKKKTIYTVAVFLFCMLFSTELCALLRPSYYRDRIQNSKIKVTAEVLSVKVVSANDVYIEKDVIFNVKKSYGEKDAFSNITGKCYSPGGTPAEGGLLYFYPEIGEEVFVTMLDENGELTSMTPLTPDLEKALDTNPETVVPGLGKVRVSDSSPERRGLRIKKNPGDRQAATGEAKIDRDKAFLDAADSLLKIIPETENIPETIRKELVDALKKASMSLIRIKSSAEK